MDKNVPDKLVAYISHRKMPPRDSTGEGVDAYCVITWEGRFLGWAWLGPQRHYCTPGCHYRRAVTVRIGGTLYHGWYFLSSGDYCRLKKAKRQSGKYAVTLYD